ncbi:MAG: hypothetical protein WBQ34_08695 [Candidatus Acidiferrales bacterium]
MNLNNPSDPGQAETFGRTSKQVDLTAIDIYFDQTGGYNVRAKRVEGGPAFPTFGANHLGDNLQPLVGNKIVK